MNIYAFLSIQAPVASIVVVEAVITSFVGVATKGTELLVRDPVPAGRRILVKALVAINTPFAGGVSASKTRIAISGSLT
jgi:hypothetical protein